MEDLNSVNEQLRKLNSRLDIIEEALTHLIEEKEAEEAQTPTPVTQQAVRPAANPAVAPKPEPRPVSQVKKSEPFSFKKKSHTNWLGLVSVVCFVFAAVFIIKLAVDSGWLTAARQMRFAALFGFILIGSGIALVEKDRAYASLLPGAGIIVLYLTAVASHSYHGLIGFEVALSFIALITAMCLWLFTVFKHEVYPITAAIGVYFSPFLLGVSAQSDFTVYYHLSTTVAFAAIAVWLETRFLTIVGAYCAIAATLLMRSFNLDVGLLVVALTVHFVAYATAVVFHSLRTRKTLSANEAWGYFPVLILFYVAEYQFITELNPVIAPWVSLAFAAFLIGLYFVSRKTLNEKALESSAVIAAFASVVFFHSLYLEILPEHSKVWLLPLILFVAAFAPVQLPKNLKPERSVPSLAIAAVLICEYVRIVFDLSGSTSVGADLILVGFVSVAAMLTLYFFKVRKSETIEVKAGAGLLGVAHVLAIVAFYRLFEPYGSLAVSASWLVYAAAVMGVGFSLKDKYLAKSALAALGLAAAKALLYDAASAATLVRIACLALTGAVLYACGFLLKKTEDW